MGSTWMFAGDKAGMVCQLARQRQAQREVKSSEQSDFLHS